MIYDLIIDHHTRKKNTGIKLILMKEMKKKAVIINPTMNVVNWSEAIHNINFKEDLRKKGLFTLEKISL